MVPEIPKNDIFIIKNFLVVVTLMAYGRVRLHFSTRASYFCFDVNGRSGTP